MIRTVSQTNGLIVQYPEDADRRCLCDIINPLVLQLGATPPPEEIPADEPFTWTPQTLGGVGPYTYEITSEQDLPAGLTLDPDTGTISGTPTESGTFVVTITVTDSQGETSELEVTLVIAAAEPAQFVANGTFDDATGWTLGSGWSISAGEAHQATDTLPLERPLVQPLINGNNYTITFDADNALEALITITLSGGAGTQVIYNSTTDGIGRTATFTATDARTTILIQTDASGSVSIDNVSLVPA
jgi:hypothetical protein